MAELGSFEAAQKWANSEMYKFIDSKMAQAQNLFLAGENKNGVNDAALFAFGEGIHSVMDNMSPAHRWFQLYDLEPYLDEVMEHSSPLIGAGYGLATFVRDMNAHAAQEAREPTDCEMNTMIDEMRMRFLYAFGREAYERAVSRGQREATEQRLRLRDLPSCTR